MIVGRFIVVDLIVMFSPSKDMWCPFLQLDSLAQQLRISRKPLERGVQTASTSMTIYLSQSVTGRGNISCKFNFGVGMGVGGGVGINRVGMTGWKQIDSFLDRLKSLLHKYH